MLAAVAASDVDADVVAPLVVPALDQARHEAAQLAADDTAIESQPDAPANVYVVPQQTAAAPQQASAVDSGARFAPVYANLSQAGAPSAFERDPEDESNRRAAIAYAVAFRARDGVSSNMAVERARRNVPNAAKDTANEPVLMRSKTAVLEARIAELEAQVAELQSRALPAGLHPEISLSLIKRAQAIHEARK